MSSQPFTVISAAPDWKIYAYNSKLGTYCEWPKDGYTGLRKDVLFDAWIREHQWVKVGESVSKSTGMRQENFKIKEKPDLGDAEKTAVLGVTGAVAVSPQALKVYNATLKTPSMGKFPLDAKIRKTLFGLSSSQYLATFSAKQESVKAANFRLPGGLKQVKDDTRVTEDGSGDGFVDLIPNN